METTSTTYFFCVCCTFAKACIACRVRTLKIPTSFTAIMSRNENSGGKFNFLLVKNAASTINEVCEKLFF